MSWNESHTEKALILSQARDSCSTKYYTFRIWSNLFYCMVFIIAHSISTALISISFIIFFSFIAHSEFFYTSFTIFILAVCKWRVNRKTYKTPDICRWIKWFLKFIFSVSSLERVYHPWLKRTIKAQCHIQEHKNLKCRLKESIPSEGIKSILLSVSDHFRKTKYYSIIQRSLSRSNDYY